MASDATKLPGVCKHGALDSSEAVSSPTRWCVCPGSPGSWVEPLGGYLSWLAGLVESPPARASLTAAAQGERDVTFNRYEWTLNGQPATGLATNDTSGTFGSGSIPTE